MVAKHIPRDYSAHRKRVIRPVGEYCGLEIFSFDPKHTRYYLRENQQLKKGDNCTATSWRSWSCYRASSTSKDMTLELDYLANEQGEYRIDLLYEQNSKLYNGLDSTGEILISKDESIIYEDDRLLFDGEDNFIKRIPLFLTLKKGTHHIKIDIPPNVYFYGVVIRKVIKYTANNYFGSDLGKDSGNMMFTSATLTISDATKPSELTATIQYNDDYECEESPSGYFIDFMDEVNFYIKNDDGEVERAFGGYVSSILPNKDNTELSLHCADRLVDGQNKYVLDEIRLYGGEDVTTSQLVKYFKNYAHVLKYLCDAHEVTLKSNISPNYLVEGEKYNKGFTITYGKSKTIKKVPVSNGHVSVANNHVTLRNKASGSKKQVWTLYDASKHSKVAPNITNYPYIHVTYGLGSPKKEVKSKITTKVDTSDTTAGTQKFSKCGVSQDKKYLMAIGLPSASKDSKKGWTKTVFERKCPNCGSTELYWGIFYAGNETSNYGRFNCTGNVEGGSAEGHIFCRKCDKDYSVQGHDHINGSTKTLKKASSTVASSKSEAYKLKNGNMRAVPKSGVEITPSSIFEAIANECKKYKYKRGSASSYSKMKKTGSGDCWAFSDLIFSKLKSYGVTCKIVQYATDSSDNHRSVLYLSDKKQWIDFPYRQYNLPKMIRNTPSSKRGSRVDYFKGVTIGKAKTSSTSTTHSETTELTTIKNYNKDAPFQGFLKITYSNRKELSAPKKTLYLRFTQRYTKGDAINEDGFPLYWVNNNTKRATFLDVNGKPLNLVDWIRNVHNNSSEDIFLQSIHMIAPKKVPTTNDNNSKNETDWYTYDKSTHDEASCKFDLYQISFNDESNINSENIASCGKTVNSMIQEVVKDTKYLCHMSYGLHRKDDIIHFRVNNERASSYTASEGDNNNILEWNSISYSPISSLHNMSIQVFKMDEKDTNNYYYVDSKIATSILDYGEQATLVTSNEPISKNEAYFNARMNEKFNGEQTYTYTITVPNYPKLKLGEFVQVRANAKKLNTLKEVKSLKVTFDWKKMPRIRTEIGLDELAPNIQLKENIRKLRREAKKETTSFPSSAVPIVDESIYEWDV